MIENIDDLIEEIKNYDPNIFNIILNYILLNLLKKKNKKQNR